MVEQLNTHNDKKCTNSTKDTIVKGEMTSFLSSTKTKTPSLAFSKTTPLTIRILIPIFCLTAHGLFYFGQVQPMWTLNFDINMNIFALNVTDSQKSLIISVPRLLGMVDDFIIQEVENDIKEHDNIMKQNIDSYHSSNTTNYTTAKVKTTTLSIRYSRTDVIQQYTYMYAIQRLWEASGIPNKFLPRLSAFLLVLFSGIWPHLKLLLLNATWFLVVDEDNDDYDNSIKDNDDKENGNSSAMRGSSYYFLTTTRATSKRTKILHWLNTLGKWSLADVLVVCVMIGIMNLDWDIDLNTILFPTSKTSTSITTTNTIDNIGVIPNFITLVKTQYTNPIDLCDTILQMQCSWIIKTDSILFAIQKLKCDGCLQYATEAYTEPAMLQSTIQSSLEGISIIGADSRGKEGGGGILLSLRIIGMVGAYVFCVAVIISILLSVIVDVVNYLSIQQEIILQKQNQHDKRHHYQKKRNEGEVMCNNNNNNEEKSVQQLDNNECFIDDEEEGQFEELLTPKQQKQRQRQSQTLSQKQSSAASIITIGTIVPFEIDSIAIKVDEDRDNFTTPRSLMEESGSTCNISQQREQPQYLFASRFITITLFTILFILMGVSTDTFQRQIYGAIPELIQEILHTPTATMTNWNRGYSLLSLTWMTGVAGGWDNLLMTTFGLFVVLGPVLRSFLILFWITWERCHCNSSRKDQVNYKYHNNIISTMIDSIGAFSSWEVLFLAVVLVQLQAPSFSNTIYQNELLCSSSTLSYFNSIDGDDLYTTVKDESSSCFQVSFSIIPLTFFFIVAGGFTLVYISWEAVLKGRRCK